MAQAMEEGARKKRKITIEDEEQDEDVKMEKFFAIIRRAKGIRDLLLESEETIQQRKAASERENIRRWQPPISAEQNLEESQERRKIAMIGVNQQDACAWAKRSEEQDDDKAEDDEDEDDDDDDDEEEDKNHRQGRRFELDLNLSL